MVPEPLEADMGFMDKFRSKATETVEEHGEQVDAGVEKAGDVVDEKTGGQYSDKIDAGEEKVKEGLDKLGDDETSGDESSA